MFTETVSDNQGDQITFEWQGVDLEALETFAVIKEFSQVGFNKSFQITVDPRNLTYGDARSYRLTLVARDQTFSKELQFVIEVLPSNQVEIEQS